MTTIAALQTPGHASACPTTAAINYGISFNRKGNNSTITNYKQQRQHNFKQHHHHHYLYRNTIGYATTIIVKVDLRKIQWKKKQLNILTVRRVIHSIQGGGGSNHHLILMMLSISICNIHNTICQHVLYIISIGLPQKGKL